MQLSLKDSDPLADAKRQLLQSTRSLLESTSAEDLESLLASARVLCLRERDLYFLDSPDDLKSSLNPQNEAAALSLLLQAALQSKGPDADLLHAIVERCNAFGQPSPASTTGVMDASSTELQRWAAEQKVSGSLAPATWGSLRGAAAAVDVAAGGVVMSVPASLLISEELVAGSDLGQALAAIPGLQPETAALIWTMVERADPESQFAPFWRSLPAAFNTGLGVSSDLLKVFEGTPAELQFTAARQHIQDQYAQLQPVLDMLTQAYPEQLGAPGLFTWAAYQWAVELWYAYALQVEFPGGRVLPCLVPLASLLNHSPWPHVVRYGSLCAATNTLDLCAFRACGVGQQCFLSYGPLPNLQLLLFYGFTVRANPHDTVSITFDEPDDDLAEERTELLERQQLTLDHSLRPAPAPLPSRLLATLRILLCEQDDLERLASCSQAGSAQATISEAGEAAVLETLAEVLQALGAAYVAALQRLEPSTQAQAGFTAFAHIFLEGQHAILRAALAEVVARQQSLKGH
ncbi:hypothetical protein WJX72_004089 [[Myrmecia] bisecta]|uniref:Rubisco LSMT substrate-binding domain-containing protein n=1 Tax=[Myrmecia] bisecta TaxID=41462 RepID=A0AAW1PNV8_9CHLO